MMYHLPKERLSFNEQPFTYTSIDFFRPISVELIQKRLNQTTPKWYSTVFPCLTIVTVNLELASDLSTVMFILAFRRFIACYVKPKEILSDNGANFIGTDQELRKVFHDLNKKFKR